MKTNIFLSILLFFLITVSCKKQDVNCDCSLGPIQKHFVTNYRDVDSLDCDVSFWGASRIDNSIPTPIDSVVFGFDARGTNYDVHWQYNTFIQIANIYGDTAFYQPASYIFFGADGAIMDTLESITILCDKLYNNSCNADRSINHLVNILFFSAKEYIESDGFVYGDIYGTGVGEWERTIRLDTFNLQQNYLLGTNFGFKLLEKPQNTDEYIFTIVYKQKDGTFIKKQFEPIFIEGEN